KTKSLNELSLEKIEKVEKSIHRINTDTSTFGKGFTLYTIYQSLLNLIERHSQKNDLNECLLDELIDICTTDSTIYARLRNMALNNKLGGLKEDVKFYLNALGINTKKELTEDMKKKVNDIIRFQEEISAQGVSGTGLGTAFSGNTTTGIASYDPVMKKMPIRRKRRL
ncbi:MAG: hypothetical protein EB127_18210, partial [Alphaproteobacteria bacterium]|nr:hypothetical protein [Alphaproteobacteria bacterium]